MTLQWGHRLSAMDTRQGPAGVLAVAQRFNGATAFRRWILDRDRVMHYAILALQWGHRLSAMDTKSGRTRTLTHDRASMGPPPFGDGYWTVPGPGSPPGTPGFNGATAFRRWIRVGYAEDRPPRLHASMGPPPFGDGYAPDGPQRDLAGVASMGPPPFGDGYHDRYRRFRDGPRQLQWGHRLSAMDTAATPKRLAGVPTGFNGATAFRRWIPGGCCGMTGRSGCFNGATAFRRWIPGSALWCWTGWPSFNGATAFRRWIRVDGFPPVP